MGSESIWFVHSYKGTLHVFPVTMCTPGQQGVYFRPVPTPVGGDENNKPPSFNRYELL